MSQMVEKCKEMQDQAVKTAQKVCKTTDEWVHDNPWWTIGMVAVTALVTGLLVGQTARKAA